MNESLTYFLLFHLGTILLDILVLSALGHMVYQSREPTSMIAWLLAIILLPYVAVPLYFIFRSRKLKRKTKSQFMLDCRGEVPRSQATQLDLILRNNGIAGATTGNAFHFYPDGVRAHDALMSHIAAAEKQILISSYVVSSDEVARSIIRALTEKAASGVDVRLLIDSIGSLPLYIFQYPLRKLRQAGGKVAFYMPLLTRPFQNYINLRNHRKIFLFDDTRVMAGGMNLSREYMGPRFSKKRWIDILFEIRGPAVFHYREIFTQDWNHTAPIKLDPPDRLPEPAGDTGIQVVPSGPDIPSDALYEALLSAIFSARERIWIVTPYFVPDKSLLQALIIARHRGVDVKLITPASSNHLIADLGRSSFMRDLDASGIEVHLYQDGMIHAKAIMVDSRGVIMGSANIDQRSLFLNYEAVSFIYSRQAITDSEAWMKRLLSRCKGRMVPAGRWRRMGENLMRVFAPYCDAMLIPASPLAPLVQSPVFFENAVIPGQFGILCWNVHKENLKSRFLDLIREWKSSFGLDLILLQEARFSGALTSVAGFPYVAAPNLRLPMHYAGVITAANAGPQSSRFHMTLAKEPLVFTPKNALVTIYRFKNKEALMVVNIHAINFKSLSWYQWELNRLFELLRAHRGAMVVAGDFNCWRRSRINILNHFTRRLDLDYTPPQNSRHVKKWFGFLLDRIYSRGLVVRDIRALNCKRLSDHNPIIARFEQPVRDRDGPEST